MSQTGAAGGGVNGGGLPFGRAAPGSDIEGRLYVIDVANIKSHCGGLKSTKSSLNRNRYYYIYPDFIPGEVNLGDLRYI